MCEYFYVYYIHGKCSLGFSKNVYSSAYAKVDSNIYLARKQIKLLNVYFCKGNNCALYSVYYIISVLSSG